METQMKKPPTTKRWSNTRKSCTSCSRRRSGSPASVYSISSKRNTGDPGAPCTENGRQQKCARKPRFSVERFGGLFARPKSPLFRFDCVPVRLLLKWSLKQLTGGPNDEHDQKRLAPARQRSTGSSVPLLSVLEGNSLETKPFRAGRSP